MKIKTAEEIFMEEAKRDMVVFDPVSFKRRFKTLFSVINNSQKKYAEQFIDLAAEEADVEYTDGPVDKQSILILKNQIK